MKQIAVPVLTNVSWEEIVTTEEPEASQTWIESSPVTYERCRYSSTHLTVSSLRINTTQMRNNWVSSRKNFDAYLALFLWSFWIGMDVAMPIQIVKRLSSWEIHARTPPSPLLRISKRRPDEQLPRPLDLCSSCTGADFAIVLSDPTFRIDSETNVGMILVLLAQRRQQIAAIEGTRHLSFVTLVFCLWKKAGKHFQLESNRKRRRKAEAAGQAVSCIAIPPLSLSGVISWCLEEGLIHDFFFSMIKTFSHVWSTTTS